MASPVAAQPPKPGTRHDVFKKLEGHWDLAMKVGGTKSMEGTYDKDKKTLTLSGEGPGMNGKSAKYKSVTTFTGDDTINFGMYPGAAQDVAFTVVYKRKR